MINKIFFDCSAIIICIFALFDINCLFSQNNVSTSLITNDKVFDSLINNSMKEVRDSANKIKTFHQDSIFYSISNPDVDWLFTKYFIQYYSNSVMININKTFANSINIIVQELNTSYSFSKKDTDDIKRSCSIKLFVKITDYSGVVSTFEVTKSLTDTLDYENAVLANNSSFPCADLPAKKQSMWSKYLQPTIAVISAAVVTSLFFIVRSK